MSEESLKTVLGFDASGAITTLKTLEASLLNYTTAMREAAKATRRYNKAAQNTDLLLAKQSKVIKGFAIGQENAATQTKKSSAALKDSSTQTKKNSDALKDIGKNADVVARQTKKVAETTKKASKQMVLSWQSVIRIFTIQVIHQAVSKLTSALTEATVEARKFEISIAEVETIADSVGLSFDQLAARAIKASIAIGQPLDVVVEAQYQLLSNQVGDATASFMAFEAAQRLSIAAVTPLNDAVALITGTLNAYGKSASEADVVAAKLFETVRLGRVRISEMGDTLGRVTVLGAQLGISLDEILASIATLTIQGVKAADAMTQILNVQLKLIRPTDAMKEAFVKLGVAGAEAGVQAFGFQGFLQKLRETTDGTASSVGELFGRVRATRAELGLTGRATDKYVKNLEGIKTATSELLTEKLELIFKTNAKQVEIELNRLNVSITEGFGRGINVAMKETFDLFGGAIETLQAFGLASGAAAATFLLMRFNVTKLALAMFGYTNVVNVATGATVRLKVASVGTTLSLKGMLVATRAFLATPLGAALAIAAAVGTIALAFRKAEVNMKKYFEDFDKFSKQTLERTLKDFSKEFEARREVFNTEIAELQKYLTTRVKLETEASNKTAIIEEQIHESIVQQMQNRTSAVENYATGIENIIDGLNSKLKKLREDSRSIKDTIEAFKFERKTKGMDDIEKFYANIKRAQELRYRSQDAINKAVATGSKDAIKLAKALNEQALQYAKQALSAADASKNRTAIVKAERKVEEIYNDQITANNKIGRLERKRVAFAEKSASGLFAQASELQSLTKQYKELDGTISGLKTTDENRIALVKKQLELASEITAELAKFAQRAPEAKALGLEEPFKEAIKAFREPLTGIKMDLSSAIIFDAIHLAKTLQVSLDGVSKQVQARISVITGLPTDAPAALQQRELLVVNEQIEAEKKRGDIAIKSKAIITDLNISNLKFTKDVTDALKEQESTWNSLQRLARSVDILPEPLEGLPAIGIDPISDQIATLGTSITGLIEQKAPIKDINQKLEELGGLQFTATDKGLFDVAFRIGVMIKNLETGRDAMAVLKEAPDTSPVINAFGGITGSLQMLEEQAKRTKAAIDAVSGGGEKAKGVSLGGLIYRQYGGFTPRGTDTIPAMLSPGEFVVNAKSSRQFFSQLVSMNAGIQPVYRAQGGPTTNVGDINITVQGATTPQQTARETMSTFKREIRRKTFNFN